jgi:hypothetical protein
MRNFLSSWETTNFSIRNFLSSWETTNFSSKTFARHRKFFGCLSVFRQQHFKPWTWGEKNTLLTIHYALRPYSLVTDVLNCHGVANPSINFPVSTELFEMVLMAIFYVAKRLTCRVHHNLPLVARLRMRETSVVLFMALVENARDLSCTLHGTGFQNFLCIKWSNAISETVKHYSIILFNGRNKNIRGWQKLQLRLGVILTI